VWRITEPDSLATTSFAYDNGFVTRTDPLLKQRTTWTDAYGRTERVRERNDEDAFDTEFRYDTLGNLIEVVDAASNSATFDYNSLGLLIESCDYDQRAPCTSFTHDAGGLVLTRTNPKGQVLGYTYDGIGRRKTKTSPTDGVTEWFYDEVDPWYGASVGRLTRVTYPGGSERYQWSMLGQQTETERCIDSTCLTTVRTYDEGRRLKTLRYPGGELVPHSYHPEGYLTSMTSPEGNYVDNVVRNARDQVTYLDYANGTAATYAYENEYKTLSSVSVAGSGGTIYHAGYEYNDASQITSI
jgi:YD repeat-containing protein